MSLNSYKIKFEDKIDKKKFPLNQDASEIICAAEINNLKNSINYLIDEYDFQRNEMISSLNRLNELTVLCNSYQNLVNSLSRNSFRN